MIFSIMVSIVMLTVAGLILTVIIQDYQETGNKDIGGLIIAFACLIVPLHTIGSGIYNFGYKQGQIDQASGTNSVKLVESTETIVHKNWIPTTKP